MAEIGSIGVVAVIEDTSGMYENAGIKVHVVSTGDMVARSLMVHQLQTRCWPIFKKESTSCLRSLKRLLQRDVPNLDAIVDGRTFNAGEGSRLGPDRRC